MPHKGVVNLSYVGLVIKEFMAVGIPSSFINYFDSQKIFSIVLITGEFCFITVYWRYEVNV